MRLRHLELHGYKTFAARTPFLFEGGITAIVGPNGSGKSNIADAIRWALGEQSFRALRGKRTEDMIFAGSSQRARLGMASVSLTLDNVDGWLPVDFSEVVITRRAYRSGENEYLVNGQRVRLRDINELLAKSGLAERTYTVVGQGLVDAVLSLRPEDRRILFEEAAGITLHQSKRAEALVRLDETRSNLLRVYDIVSELAPRLRRLEVDAERADRHRLLSQQLEGLLRVWYGFRWRQEQAELRRARDASSRHHEILNRRHAALSALDERSAGLRSRQAEIRGQLAAWHRESGDLHRQMEEVQRDLAVWRERGRLLERQSDELQSELTELAAQLEAAGARAQSLADEVAACESAWRGKEEALTQAQAQLKAHEEQRAGLAHQMAEVQARIVDLATQAGDRQNRLAQLIRRRGAAGSEVEEHEHAVDALAADLERLGASLRAIEADQTGLQSEVGAIALEQSRLETVVAEANARQADLRTELADHKRVTVGLQGRYDLLSRWHAEGEGLGSGVRAILQAARGDPRYLSTRGQRHSAQASERTREPLQGIVGTVSEILRVPPEYEAAVELALGSHLQDLVVQSWRHAMAALAYLAAGRLGRASLLPLDLLRPGQCLEVPALPGLVGLASDLVRTEADLAPVAQLLLGSTVLVHNREAARSVLEVLGGDCQVVTLDLEVWRSDGLVAGGVEQEAVGGQLLGREREWRELPGQLAIREAQTAELETALRQVEADEKAARAEGARCVAQRRELDAALANTAARRSESERQVDRVRQQWTWRQELIKRLDAELAELSTVGRSCEDDLAQLAVAREAAEQQAVSLGDQLEQLRGENLYQGLSEARTAAALARGAWDHSRAVLDSHLERRAQLDTQVESKQRRRAALLQEQTSLAQQMADRASREVILQHWLASLAGQIEPAEAEVARLELEREALESQENDLRLSLRKAEESHAQASLAASRREDSLQALRRQIMDDLSLVTMEAEEGVPEQLPLPFGSLVSTLPVVEVLPPGLEEEIRDLRARLRRVGAVNPTAPEEYAELAERQAFLAGQAKDLEEAAKGLREVIAELDELMRREFQSTFEAVAARFRENFARLFGGGSARLVLSDPDDLSATGVDITARPPGKRQQPLALLSGGERSLTAVALLFSILEVNPPPFCILDEVDAMLDEANVRRFREVLDTLAEKTQFIVITHNRVTVEAADTIYGISMGEDSASQVISLRLEADRIATVDGTALSVQDD